MKYLILALTLLLTLGEHSFAQRNKKKKTEPAEKIDTDLFKALKWRNIGPFRGGRSVAVSGVVGDPLTYYMGSTGGGLWKTTDAGVSWSNVSDPFFKSGSVGAIGVAESDPNVIYVGMGEHAVRGVMTSHGDGIYKSTDAGKTWKHVGLPNSRHISDVIVHPADPETVYVSVQGALHNSSADRGIYRTTDGGASWNKVLYVDENTGASGLSMDMNNPRILYAAMWEHKRLPWKVSSGGPGSGLHKSTDGGTTWTKLSEGLPESMGKIGVSVSRANSQRVYAVIEAEGKKAGVYRSDNGGELWVQTNTDRVNIARAWYYIEIFADPVDEETVYVLNAPIMRSIDGGKTFTNVPVGHGDTHDLWIDPQNNKRVINANDGGGTISFNAGKTWSTLNNQPTAQFYRVITDNQFPYYVYGGQQDNSSMAIASRTNFIGIGWKDWYAAAGGESAYLAFDPNNPEVIYGSSIEGFISRFDTKTKENKSIDVYPQLLLGMIPKDMKYRFNWNPPLVASPHDPAVMYYGANVLLKTTDGGINWDEISPDLTRNDVSKQGPGGGPYTNEAAGGENYNTIMYVEESSIEKGLIWVGSDDGLVHLTRDEGDNWSNVTPSGLPEGIVNCIDASPHEKGTAYMSLLRYKFGDLRPYVYKTSDYGASWTSISNGIDPEHFVRAVREDLKVKGLLYAGTERGFYISPDNGKNWNLFQLNLPNVPITDITSKDNDLIISTAGRGFWILDDLGPIQQSRGMPDAENAMLFEPKTSVRFEANGFAGIQFPNTGMNPLNGVILDYFLPEEMDSISISMEVVQGDQVIRKFTNQKEEGMEPFPGGPPPMLVMPAKKGVNRMAWDLRKETVPGISKTFVFGDYRGHLVGPGDYTIRLIVKEDTFQTVAKVKVDPRLGIRADDYVPVQKMLDEIDITVTDIHESINKMRAAKEQMVSRNKFLKAHSSGDTLINKGQAIIEQIDNWEQQLIQTKHETFQDVVNFESQLSSHLSFLKGYIDSHDPTVTASAKTRLEELKSEWAEAKEAMQKIIDEEVGAYNTFYKQREVPAIIVED